MNLYQEGDPIHAWCDFRPVDGGAIDPTTIYFAYTAPGQSTETVLSVGGGGLTMLDSVRATVTLPTYGHPGNWVGEWYVVRAGQHQRVAPWAARVEDRRLDLPTAVPDPLPTDSTSGNPWAPYRITTTDATPTLLLRIPVAADQGVWVQPTSWPAMVLRLDGANAGDSTSLSLYGPLRRIGAAAPTTIPGLVWIPAGSFYPTPPTGLVGIAAAATISTDHIDVMVTGLVGATIRWTWPAPALLYF